MPLAPTLAQASALRPTLAERFRQVRAHTDAICAPLVTEDYVVQSMPDVSPTKWHLAHTTWFWETFVLREHASGYRLYDEAFPFLFNSYYVQAGERHCRAQRGYLSRPTVAEVKAYRAHVDRAMEAFLDTLDEASQPALADLVEVGLHHEQQHQELMLTDIKHVFSVNPLRPAYAPAPPPPAESADPLVWLGFEGGVVEIGAEAGGETSAARFHFDNEGPRHRQFVEPFEIGHRLVTAGEYAEFVEDGGYRRAALWLSAGWATVQAEGWTAPFYWEPRVEGGPWRHFTLAGVRELDPGEPVTHLSYYEADAFARWAAQRWPGARLPSEFEWEVAARSAWADALADPSGFVEGGRLHPGPGPSLSPAGGDGSAALTTGGTPAGPRLEGLAGHVWQWTHSAYTAYPGYRPVEGALGEYNGKFMSGQFVLRGGSVATSRTHVRPSYRNFFPPEATWQFTGLRLARSV